MRHSPQSKTTPNARAGIALLWGLALGACADGSSNSFVSVNGATTNRPLSAPLGEPLPGLNDAQLAAFERGKKVFMREFTPAEGLGPLYNATSCSSCHSTPVPGGSAELYRNFYIAMAGTAPLQSSLPPLPSPVVPAYGPQAFGGAPNFSLETGRFVIPPTYFGTPVVSAQRNSIPIFGTGLFEFISNFTILANEDPFDADGNGISGRANIDFGDVGRFGVKAQANNIERFTRPPLNNQMGITSDPFRGSGGTVTSSSAAPQGTGNPDLPLLDNDPIPDPEISRADLGDLIAFTRFLAPPPRRTFNREAEDGERLFDEIGCTDCHIPVLPSALGPVEAYTDLLLHDLGPALADGLQFGAPFFGPLSTGSEYRTQPLWGVSLHSPFLHDGRAETLEEAVDMHGGEAQAARDAFRALPQQDQTAVITFLEHL